MPSNVENILNGILTGDGSGIQKPASRVEELLFEIYEQGGGGGDSVIGGIKLTIDNNYVMTATLVDKDGEEYGVSDDIDLPLEEMVVDAEYDPQTQKIKLELKNGNYVEFSVAELVSGLQTELSSSNKLNPAYIDYDASHRAVSDTEKNTWNAKQNAISDLDTIRSGASAGATAVQPSEMQTALSAKQDTISDLAAIRSGASAGASAVQPETMSTALALKQDSLDNTQLAAVNSGINSTKVAQIETNKTDISLVQDATEELVDSGAKNRLQFNGLSSYTSNGVTFTINADYSVTATRTETSTSSSFVDLLMDENLVYIDDLCDGDHYISGCPANGGDDTYELSATSDHGAATYIKREYGEGALLTTAPANADVIVRLTIRPNFSGSATFKPMICTKADWNVSPKFVPHTLPNSELTKLESEDRSNILYALETGASNYAPIEGDTVTGSSNFLNATRAGMKVFPSGTVLHVYCEYTKATNTQLIIGMTNSAGSFISGCEIYTPLETTTSFITADVTLTQDAYGYLGFYSGSAGDTCTVSKVMICPKTVWDAIQKYVPYSVPNHDLTKLETENRAALVEQVDEGAKNKFNPEKATTNPDRLVTDGNGYAFKSVDVDTRTTIAFVLNAYNNNTYVRQLVSGDITNTGLFSCTFVKASDFNFLRFGHSGGTLDLQVTFDASDLEDGETYVLSFNVTATNPSVLLAWNSTMFCTEADWNVSHNFEPYALSNYQLTQEVNALHERTDQIQPVVYFSAGEPGWYRVFTLGIVEHESIANGARDNSCNIVIKRIFANDNNEHHEIKLASIFQNMGFTDEFSKSETQIITNIRYVATINNAYIDIYYSSSAINSMTCSINNNAGEFPWKAVNTVVKVPETTTGETVWASYDFNANYDPSFLADKTNVVTVATTDTEALYSDLTVTVPPFTAYRITAFLNYNQTAPKSITLSVSDNPSDYAGRHLISKATNPSSELLGQLVTSSVVIATGNNAKNVYVWASSLSAGDNRIYTIVEKLTKF